MRQLKKAAAALLAAVLTVGTFASASGITVKMDALTGKVSQIVNFGDLEPIQTDNTTLAPARDLAESAGMSIEWNQPTQTALITLNADAESDKPIERYASELINKVGGFGLELTPQNITAALKLGDSNAVIRYNFADTEGDIVAIGKTVEMDSAAELVNDGALMIPVRSSMELFGLDVEWNQEDLTAKVSVPDYVIEPRGLQIIPEYSAEAEEINTTTAVDVEENDPVNEDPSLGTYIGRFKITHYCPCSICNGGWGAYTAWAGAIIPGQTIAVDPNIIPKLSWVYIDGYGLRRAEDCGGAIKGYHIDMAVSSHSEAYRLGVVYKDVYMANN